MRWTTRGTHEGEYLGILAAGKQIELSGLSIHRFAEGQIRESWDAFDNLSMMQQLGLIPPAN